MHGHIKSVPLFVLTMQDVGFSCFGSYMNLHTYMYFLYDVVQHLCCTIYGTEKKRGAKDKGVSFLLHPL